MTMTEWNRNNKWYVFILTGKTEKYFKYYSHIMKFVFIVLTSQITVLKLGTYKYHADENNLSRKFNDRTKIKLSNICIQ